MVVLIAAVVVAVLAVTAVVFVEDEIVSDFPPTGRFSVLVDLLTLKKKD